jgi:fructosamine-3-kinase
MPADEPIEAFLATLDADTVVGDRLRAMPPHLVHEVRFDGRRAVCKVSTGPRGRAGVEGRVLRLLDRTTDVPVPEPLAVGDDGFVVAWHDDVPAPDAGEERRLPDGWLRAAGRGLARLHAETTTDRAGLLAVGPPDPDRGRALDDAGTDPPLWLDAAPGTPWSEALDAQLAVYEDAVTGTGFADVVADARTFLATHADRFDGVAAPSLCHGWWTPEHVAVRDDAVARVVDFEHALVGSPEWDYWRTAVPLFVAGDGQTTPDDAATRFRAGYESIRSLPNGFDERGAAYRAFVSVSYLDSLHAQRGIDAATRDRAAFLRDHATTTFDRLRESWG